MGPASAALAAGLSTGSAVQRKLQQRPRAAAAAIACAAVGSGALAWHARRDGLRLWPRQQRFLHPMAVHAISGAAGEIVQIAALYPLDTIKVRCQARGLKTSVLIHELRGSACRRSAFLGLYAGLGTAAAASAVIGACYLLSFHAAKGAAQRGAAAAISHRKEHRRRQHGQSDSTAAASPSAAAESRSVADGSASRQAGGEHSHGVAWNGIFELLHEPPRLSGGPHSSAFASISEAGLVARRGHAVQQQQQQQRHHHPRHAQLGQHHSSSLQPSATAFNQQSRSEPAAGPGLRGHRDSAAERPAPASGFNAGEHAISIMNDSRPMPGDAAGAVRRRSVAAVTFRVGACAAAPSSPAAVMESASSAVDTAQHAPRPEPRGASPPSPAPSSVTNPWVDSSAALCASAVTSLLEGPVEMFRHRLQAGVTEGKLLSNMGAALSGGGLRSVYAGYLSFMISNIPYDVAELCTYSRLSAWRERRATARSSDGAPGDSGFRLPDTAVHLLCGATAGAAAVLASMPADCVKTVLEMETGSAARGFLGDAGLFVATARGMLEKGGPGALFIGMGPRLAETVPSTMFYWFAVEACRRALEPYTIQPGDSAVADGV